MKYGIAVTAAIMVLTIPGNANSQPVRAATSPAENQPPKSGTLEAEKDIEASGFSREQAASLTRTVRTATAQQASTDDLDRATSRLEAVIADSILTNIMWIVGMSAGIAEANITVLGAMMRNAPFKT